MGHLNLRWKRRQRAVAGAAGGSGGVETAVAGVGVAEDVTSQLELPAVRVQDGLLSVRVVAPAHATAGIAFPYTLQVSRIAATAIH